MCNAAEHQREVISEPLMLARIAQSEQMREFFIQMWIQNPALAKQGGARVQSLLTPLDRVEPDAKAATSYGATKQRGISLVELIVFIVIISTALMGILSVMNLTTSHSADPLVHKQALAIAESLLEEVELKPFTYCDPDDANASTATAALVGAADCAATIEVMGAEAGETRTGVPQFDNVNDYSGLPAMAAGAITDIAGSPVGGGGYTATIAVVTAALNGTAAVDANGAPQVLQITVTVTGPDGVPIVLDGYRTRYSPNGVP